MLEIVLSCWFIVGGITAIFISIQVGGHPILSTIFGMIAGPLIVIAWIVMYVEHIVQKKGP
jgi:hypothetical protein